jgi:beta-N-acetylhexosaminidase
MFQATPILLGLSGLRLSELEIRFIQDVQPVGFLLFGRNIESLEQVLTLTTQLKNLSKFSQPLIAVDQEGGRVQRIKFRNVLPPPAVFGEWYRISSHQACTAARLSGFLLATQLREVGANWLLGPSVDLFFPETHQIIGNRAFSSDPEIVSILGNFFMQGVEQGGCLTCLKHAPGHGRSTLDTHFELPMVTASADEMQLDLYPYRKLASKTSFIMTAHIRYSAFSSEIPVTFNRKFLDEFRHNIGFKGLILADDLGMNALQGEYPDRVLKALNAGCDIGICSFSKLKLGMAGTEWDEENFIKLTKAKLPSISPEIFNFIKNVQIPSLPTPDVIESNRREFFQLWSGRPVGLDINLQM